MSKFERTELLLGSKAMDVLAGASVCVFGLGGVGSFAVEALARSGVGRLTLVDGDRVSQSNINRQVIALESTVGQYKTDVMAARIADINLDAKVACHSIFYRPENAGEISFEAFDYVVDAIDTVTSKLEIIGRAAAAGVPVISSMGMGNRLDPSLIEITDIYKTNMCPIARVMRHELKKQDIKALKVVCSTELPIKKQAGEDQPAPPGSVAFVPPVAGLMMAAEVIKDIILEYR